jgi:hypothetical protein
MSDNTKQPAVEQVTQQQAPAVMIDLTLFLEEVNLILGSLGNLPFNQVSGLIEKLKAQAIPQLPQEAPQAAEDTAVGNESPAA